MLANMSEMFTVLIGRLQNGLIFEAGHECKMCPFCITMSSYVKISFVILFALKKMICIVDGRLIHVGEMPAINITKATAAAAVIQIVFVCFENLRVKNYDHFLY